MSALHYIDVPALRPGMYVQLELGWMDHPFPTNSFLIHSAAQIDVLRGLGLKQVRWDPRRSEAVAPAATATAPVQDAAASGRDPVATATAPEPAPAPRDMPALQRAAQVRCERHYAEAGRGWRDTVELLRTGRPTDAGARATAVARALIRQMLDTPDGSIRLITEAASDRGSAHVLNVTVLSLLLARQLGWSEAALAPLGVGALLHDVGKLDLPERVRHPDGHFTDLEHRLYREHVALGLAQARRMEVEAEALLVIAQHHEQADGSGFPLRLKLDRQAQGARIVALANRYDNLCNPAQASSTHTPHEALSLLYAQGQRRFDAQLLGAFVRMMGVYPPGSVVQLSDGRYALVASVNATHPLRPCVLVHDACAARGGPLPLELEHAPQSLAIRRSLKPAQLPCEVRLALAPGRRVAWFFDPTAAPPAQDTQP
ncbi:HD-GYP domain-containing protein [Azohydromonas aeria]|uniref:HD-GYP domain-containing protein n=1 Tax=Azohydromonas aeria TaxID=2590212 RepID=UPI001E3315EE|nr:HD-GYP domain-containing protein [Azohydromonas aeria]